jgi:hypothetical protein
MDLPHAPLVHSLGPDPGAGLQKVELKGVAGPSDPGAGLLRREEDKI